MNDKIVSFAGNRRLCRRLRVERGLGSYDADSAKLSLSNFLAGDSDDPLQAPPSFTTWMRLGAWAVELYEPSYFPVQTPDHDQLRG